MADYSINKGLDLPLAGKPEQEIHDGPRVNKVALLGRDYPTMKPRMRVQQGDKVKRGQPLFDDRKTEGVTFTSPAAGEVVAINRGEKRAFQSVVIALSESELSGQPSDDDFAPIEASIQSADKLDGAGVRALLTETGLWTALRARPYDRVPSPSGECAAVFVTATDTNPGAASVEVALDGEEEAFKEGLKAVAKLTSGKTHLCVGPNWKLDVSDVAGVEQSCFTGPHPAGLVGTHIHMICPAHRERTIWHIGYQDVLAIGLLIKTGRLDTRRVVALSGPVVQNPRLFRTRLGASLLDLTADNLVSGAENRIVSGSVLFGYEAQDEIFGYLHRYHTQVSSLAEDRERVMFGWLAPGVDKFSTVRAFLSRWFPQSDFKMTTTTHGSHRAMVPIGMYERVMPLDIAPTFLLRSLLVGDVERAEQLGCLELTEEDLALCSFVSPGKEDYGVALRKVLTEIWQEG